MPNTNVTNKRPTPDQWATRILLQAHAIAPCPDHGYMRLRFDHAAIDHAHALAEHDRLPGTSKAKCVEIVDAVLDGLADECPACV